MITYNNDIIYISKRTLARPKVVVITFNNVIIYNYVTAGGKVAILVITYNNDIIYNIPYDISLLFNLLSSLFSEKIGWNFLFKAEYLSVFPM